MLLSAPCSPLLLFLTIDIVPTLVAFMGEIPGLLLAKRFALPAADHVRASHSLICNTCLSLLVAEGLPGWDGVWIIS